jgi:hypothetical protein
VTRTEQYRLDNKKHYKTDENIIQLSTNLKFLIIMSKLFVVLACLALVVAVASAESKPRFAKLQTKLGCSMTEIFACESEIEGKKCSKTYKLAGTMKLPQCNMSPPVDSKQSVRYLCAILLFVSLQK